ncbi:MAG: riboflavin biosynthesis protein [Candidatus Binatia bacterium]|nr:MAG: riboflavin biosynthesis protein [Candidatus Binatia bacterium]
MRLVRGLHRVPEEARRRVVTIGNFDGVHLGHREICRVVSERAKEYAADSLALTFYPHPLAVLAPEKAPELLLRFSDRLRLLFEAGIEVVVAQRFTREFSRIPAEEFVRRHLVEKLGAVHVVVGHNVRFGRDRRGDGNLLRECGAKLGFSVDVVGPVRVGETVVSSTTIRKAVLDGDMDRARALLGRPYFVRGRVVHGTGRGRTLGYPTANLFTTWRLLPPNGVYAVLVTAEGVACRGIANLGVRPTFGGVERSLEAHLFDFRGDLYGKRLRVAFVRRLREERRFESPEALRRQIDRDAELARRVLDEL